MTEKKKNVDSDTGNGEVISAVIIKNEEIPDTTFCPICDWPFNYSNELEMASIKVRLIVNGKDWGICHIDCLLYDFDKGGPFPSMEISEDCRRILANLVPKTQGRLKYKETSEFHTEIGRKIREKLARIVERDRGTWTSEEP